MSRSRKAPAPERPTTAGSVAASERPEDDEYARRVERLREQVREGTYVPDPYEIARRILEEGL